jgi:hypothetical protein
LYVNSFYPVVGEAMLPARRNTNNGMKYEGGYGGHLVNTWLNDLIDYWRSLGIQVTVHE